MIKKLQLRNGIRVVMEQIPYVQSVSLGIWVKTGCVNETSEIAGISHFIEHMMFKGTKTRTAKQIAEDVDRIGGQINAFTSKETTCYYIKTLCSNLYKGADILIDMLSNSTFSDYEMDKERQVICEEIKMTLDTPDELAADTIVEEVFKGESLGKSIIGTPETLKNINSKVMFDYYKKQYTRDSIVVSIAGNFDEKSVLEYFEDKLLELGERKDQEISQFQNIVPSNKVIVKDIEQSHICLATKCDKFMGDYYYNMSVLNNIFGGSMSSRLFQNIREEKGLAYSVFSLKGMFSYDGYFNIYAGVSHDKIKEAIIAVKEELASLKEHGITDDELAMAKEQIKSSFTFSQENVASRMFSMGKSEILVGKHVSPEEITSNIDRVDMKSIKQAIDLISNWNKYCAVVVTNKDFDLKGIMNNNEN